MMGEIQLERLCKRAPRAELKKTERELEAARVAHPLAPLEGVPREEAKPYNKY